MKRLLIAAALTTTLTGCLATFMPGKSDSPATTAVISPEHIELMRTLNTTDLTQYAEKGDQYAQYYLGNKYAQGADTPQDMGKAKQLWELSAKQGNANSLYNLGMIYFSGQGAPQNLDTALSFFQQSANAGNTRAALQAGSMFETGQGTTTNLPVAAQFYEMAAKTQPNAAYRLAMLLTRNTPDLPADYNRAYELLQQAATQGDRLAPRALSIFQNYPQDQAIELLNRLNTSI